MKRRPGEDVEKLVTDAEIPTAFGVILVDQNRTESLVAERYFRFEGLGSTILNCPGRNPTPPYLLPHDLNHTDIWIHRPRHDDRAAHQWCLR